MLLSNISWNVSFRIVWMPKFIFWNINKKPLQNTISQLAHYYDVDIVLLAECSIHSSLLLKTLNQDNQAAYHYAPGVGCQRIEIFTRFNSDYLSPIFEDSRWTIRHLNLPGLLDILLVVVHLPSKIHYSDADQKSICVRLINDVREVEDSVGHSRTILVGDFNMNPFEDGIVAADALHSVMTKSIAAQQERTVQGKGYRFFYNPMWNMFGDFRNVNPGTYYYKKSSYTNFFWNIFDQVLVGPDLLERFDNTSLKILASDGLNNYLTHSGEPDHKNFSDHLPIKFEINL